jgi:hypothetical protein
MLIEPLSKVSLPLEANKRSCVQTPPNERKPAECHTLVVVNVFDTIEEKLQI